MSAVDEFRRQARSWIAQNKSSAPPDWGAIMPPERREQGMQWQSRLFEAGYAGIHWPVEYGGRGLTVAHHTAWAEECQSAGVPSILNMVGLVLAAGALMGFGTEAQRHAHLPETVRGQRVWCQLFSEPGAGSDLASLSTKAERDGDTWVVNGQKVWCSGGRASDWGILLARTEPDARKHEGISFFVIDMHSPGVEVRPLKQMTGEAEFDEVFFTDVHLPADALIGDRGQGWMIAMATLTSERGHIGGSGKAIARALGELLADADRLDAVKRDRLMALYAAGRAYLLMAERQGSQASAASSLGKLAMTLFRFDLAEFRADAEGPQAMLDGAGSRGLMAAPGGWFGGGTSQVQRNIIGERILGLPREPRP